MAVTLSTGWLQETVGGIRINCYIPCKSGNYSPRSSRFTAFVVMHYTGNRQDKAENNAKYFSSASVKASAHFFVDDTAIYQSVPLKDEAWHCGAVTYFHDTCRNQNSIGIEMCCTAGDYRVSDTTKENAAQLCARLCQIIGIRAADVDTYVLRHYDVTHKACPAQMSGEGNGEWAAFRERVRQILRGVEQPMSEDQVRSIIREEIEEYFTARAAREPEAAWEKEQYKRVVDRGITDGSRPMAFCTRLEAAIMAGNAGERPR